MDGNSKQPSNGGVLKTTTWGTLIALSLLVTAWGFSGRWRGNSGDSNSPQAVARFATPQPSISQSVKPAQSPSPADSPSRNVVVDADRHEPAVFAPAAPAERGTSASSLSASSATMPQANPKGPNSDGASSGAGRDSQVLMAAAKI